MTKTEFQRVLSIDVGGTGLKASVLDRHGKMLAKPVRIPTPYPCPPKVLIQSLVNLANALPRFDRVSVGFPGFIKDNVIITAPHFGNEIWANFPLAKALSKKLGKPVRVINDAEMAGWGVIRSRGLELVITLGTGLGTAIFLDGNRLPHFEFAHHPVHNNQTYDEYVGKEALKKKGKKKWNRRVRYILEVLDRLMHYNRVYIGGGNSKNITFKLRVGEKLVSNNFGIIGGIALWTNP